MAYVTAKVLAEHLGVNVQTVYRWAQERRIPHYKMGRSVRYVISEVEESLKVDPVIRVPERVEARRAM